MERGGLSAKATIDRGYDSAATRERLAERSIGGAIIAKSPIGWFLLGGPAQQVRRR